MTPNQLKNLPEQFRPLAEALENMLPGPWCVIEANGEASIISDDDDEFADVDDTITAAAIVLLCNQAPALLAALAEKCARVAELVGIIRNPPRHRFWGAGETGCPRSIKAANGELHTMRCKVCGCDNPRDEICRSALNDFALAAQAEGASFS